jgi:hypothetical protein
MLQKFGHHFITTTNTENPYLGNMKIQGWSLSSSSFCACAVPLPFVAAHY